MKIRLLALFLALSTLLCACVSSQIPTDPVQSIPSTAPSTQGTEPSTAPSTGATEPTEPSEPPATNPPVTEPPITEPPVTEPPVMEHQCPDTDPYENVNKEAFYASYTPACCRTNALYRSEHGLLSGILEVPGQYAQEAQHRPMEDGKYLRNTAATYADDGNTYIVYNSAGKEVLRIYKGGGYITLEEVAAYMYAFGGSSGSIPANYTSSKNTRPGSSIWGEYLRVNHSQFSGNTSKYPYEPELPDISGCGGALQYYEMDIGTTGTTPPGYAPEYYNDGNSIARGAARIVYTRYDKNRNGIFENDEVYVFYTHNHYNDFREYLNYYGGWGEMFGNVTGGGQYSSKTNCNPTPYVYTGFADFTTFS